MPIKFGGETMLYNFEALLKKIFIERGLYQNYSKEPMPILSPYEIRDTYRRILDKIAIGIITADLENENIIDAILQLARVERIVIVFNLFLDIKLSDLSIILDTTPDSIYAQKSTALKKLKNLLK